MDAGFLFQFAKAPIPGQVKTRMRPALTPAHSCTLHTQLLAHCFQQAAEWRRAQPNWQHWLAVSPADHEHWSQFSACNFWPQPQGDLGARMAAAVNEGLSTRKGKWVILIGSDCPALDCDYFDQAAAALAAGAPLVVGPARDGGYVLIGMSVPLPLFEGVSWGGDCVFSQTLAKARAAGVEPVILPTLHDIDRPEDLSLLAKWPALASWIQFVE
ncbi:TIGR04282 family arsenosugar biosynthesis glycosyltransferase [Simiduia aestuariiviva]|uniref:Glycosyltransferase n=1 Tax=Simiduia aestuariiviva TaxID=1510459 RepID=A0A839UPM6_9GAMM|nr:TIGR04282 family arsenosugar biosynthesis glycosyltransferase [Simiduia aestuariiviva]MBB3168470.1 hypothetical protein [Simiduia aestuariiviva]